MQGRCHLVVILQNTNKTDTYRKRPIFLLIYNPEMFYIKNKNPQKKNKFQKKQEHPPRLRTMEDRIKLQPGD